MGQTIAMSNSDQWQSGRTVNVESAMAAGEQLGGHIVQGHVDGTSTVIETRQSGDWRVIRFALTREHAPLIVDKGSITIDGVSLTVSTVGDDWCEVSLIPETLVATTLGSLAVGDTVNIETDILARHIARLAHFTKGTFA
jgi:riboflavin synthase